MIAVNESSAIGLPGFGSFFHITRRSNMTNAY